MPRAVSISTSETESAAISWMSQFLTGSAKDDDSRARTVCVSWQRLASHRKVADLTPPAGLPGRPHTKPRAPSKLHRSVIRVVA